MPINKVIKCRSLSPSEENNLLCFPQASERCKVICRTLRQICDKLLMSGGPRGGDT